MRTANEITALRDAAYNAVITHIRLVHDELMVLRVRLDAGAVEYVPGQYTTLGLGHWEPRLDGAQPEALGEGEDKTLAKRAYSMSSSLLDQAGTLVRPRDCPDLEFYVTLVRAAESPPVLTPRLFALSEGDRLFVGPRAKGRYTLEPVKPDNTVLFVATGTGEAPHNAMTAELLATGHRGRIVSLTCVRLKRDLGYLFAHRALMERHANYRYVFLTTREPENLDTTAPGYVGKQYVQDFVGSGQLDLALGGPLDPLKTHVYLCGNPAMIAGTERPDGTTEGGMVQVLESKGFVADRPKQPGNIHQEKYW